MYRSPFLMAGTVSSDVTDGPVLSVINKRIRALRKKYNRIVQMEESGKVLNKEQEENLRSKPFVLSAIDELEKLKQPISIAVSEEISNVVQQKQHNIQPTDSSSEPNEHSEINSGEETEKLKKEALEDSEGYLSAVQDLLNLVYFGSLFDVKTQNDFMATMLTRTHERGCCLTYDYVTDDDAAELLGERDLDLISMLGGLLTSRAVDSSFPHKNALLRCVEHAKSWLDNSDQQIVPDSEITYAKLRQKLNKIMASEYFTKAPEMKVPLEFQPSSFQVPSQETILTVNVLDQVEVPQVQYEQKEEIEVVKTQGIDNFDSLSTSLNDIYQGDEGEKYSEIHVDTGKTEIEKGLEYIAEASNQYNRGGGRGGSRGGGGRRGYSNGRRGNRGGNRGGGGGGAYFNGRNQYYEQGDGYYPRNNYYRGRGGRGGGGSGSGSGSNHNYQVGEGGYLVAN